MMGTNNLKARKFRLAVRNFVNRHTGQNSLIEEYNDAVMAIARASDASKSAEFKKKALAVLQSVDGGKTVTDGAAFWKEGGFNPYKPLQKKKLRENIAVLQKAIRELGISR